MRMMHREILIMDSQEPRAGHMEMRIRWFAMLYILYRNASVVLYFYGKVVHAEIGMRVRVRFRPARHRITELSYLPKLE